MTKNGYSVTQRTIYFKNCVVNVDFERCYTETVFDDKAIVPACPQDSDEYRANAVDLGYGDDTFAMSREHEIIHTAACEMEGKPYSPTLYHVAHPEAEVPLADRHVEEKLILDLQRYMNGQAASREVNDFCERVGKTAEDVKCYLIGLCR